MKTPAGIYDLRALKPGGEGLGRGGGKGGEGRPERWNHELWNPSDPRFLEIHHIKPHEEGGDYSAGNLATYCNVCPRYGTPLDVREGGAQKGGSVLVRSLILDIHVSSFVATKSPPLDS